MKTVILNLIASAVLLTTMSCQQPLQEKEWEGYSIDTWEDGIHEIYVNGALEQKQQLLSCRAKANGLTRRYFTLVKTAENKLIFKTHVVVIAEDRRMLSFIDHVYIKSEVEVNNEDDNITKINLRLSSSAPFDSNIFFPVGSDLENLQEGESAIEFMIDKSQSPISVSAITTYTGLSASSDLTNLECRVLALNLK